VQVAQIQTLVLKLTTVTDLELALELILLTARLLIHALPQAPVIPQLEPVLLTISPPQPLVTMEMLVLLLITVMALALALSPQQRPAILMTVTQWFVTQQAETVITLNSQMAQLVMILTLVLQVIIAQAEAVLEVQLSVTPLSDALRTPLVILVLDVTILAQAVTYVLE